MKGYTPPQIKLLQHLRDTGQTINVDARGRAFLADGTQVNQLTLRALVKKRALAPCATDLFGQGVTAYTMETEEKAA